MTRTRDPSRPRSEAGLVAATARHLEERGYRVYVDPDGSNYFDLACRRDDDVGLVEAKLGNPTQLLNQALRRRAWAGWVAVVVPSPRTAATIVRASAGRRAEPVGVWCLARGAVSVVRPARSFDRRRRPVRRAPGAVPDDARPDRRRRAARRAPVGRPLRGAPAGVGGTEVRRVAAR